MGRDIGGGEGRAAHLGQRGKERTFPEERKKEQGEERGETEE